MAKYHVAKDNKVKQCRSKESANCKAQHDKISEHFESKELAEAAADKILVTETPVTKEKKATKKPSNSKVSLKNSDKNKTSILGRKSIQKSNGEIIELPISKETSKRTLKKEPKRPVSRSERVKTLEEKVESLEKELLESKLETSIVSIRASEAMAEGSKYEFIENDLILHDKINQMNKAFEVISNSGLFTEEEIYELSHTAFSCEVSTFLIRAANFFTYRQNFKREMPWLKPEQKALIVKHNSEIVTEREKLNDQLRSLISRAPSGFKTDQLMKDFYEISESRKNRGFRIF